MTKNTLETLSFLQFLVYINDLVDGVSSNAKLFVDDASLFSIIHGFSTSANELNNDFYQINKWGFQWKMSLTQTQTKSRKTQKNYHPLVQFNNNFFSQTPALKTPWNLS